MREGEWEGENVSEVICTCSTNKLTSVIERLIMVIVRSPRLKEGHFHILFFLRRAALH